MSSIPRSATDDSGRELSSQAVSVGFPPVARSDARILILGSLPGQRSLTVQQYYAHPRNVFWRIMGELVGAEGDYASRCQRLVERGIALWDVLESSCRPGSLDADIRLPTASANDFAGFFAGHREIRRIGFNGQTAARMFTTLVVPALEMDRIEQIGLPSTSPAYAAMPYADKLERWRDFLNRAGAD